MNNFENMDTFFMVYALIDTVDLINIFLNYLSRVTFHDHSIIFILGAPTVTDLE